MKNNNSTHDEVELIKELKSDSEEAFDAIYVMYFKRLYAYCLKFTKSDEDTEEIVQDVFLHLWEIRHEIRQEETLRSLLFIISKNYLIKSFHKCINSQIFEDYIDYKDCISSNERTDYELEFRDYLQQIRVEMNKLSETQKKVIELSRLGDLSIEETAHKLNLSEQTVRNQLSIGLKSLKVLIERNLVILLLIFKFSLF